MSRKQEKIHFGTELVLTKIIKICVCYELNRFFLETLTLRVVNFEFFIGGLTTYFNQRKIKQSIQTSQMDLIHILLQRGKKK